MPGGPIPPVPLLQPSMTTQQFLDLGKVPDIVRDVKPFNGSPTELIDWLADVDSIFNVYREQRATTSQISILERTIRRKIGGEAADILNANNIKCDWTEIKETLVLYYRDKRDIKTLDYELTSIKKSNNENISSYYSRVNELLSHIIVQVQTDDKMKINASVHIDYFRDKSLDAFIRGLERPLSILLKSTNPTSLGTAYQFCVEYYNMDIRSAPYRNELGGQPTPKPREPPRVPPRPHAPISRPVLPPPLPPPRNTINPFHNSNPFRQTQHQTNPFNSNPFRQTQHYNPFNQNNSQKPLPPPEPMEVDPSIRTKNVNYGNRPQTNQKRPLPPSQQHQNFKRQAHPLDSNNQNPETHEHSNEHYYDEQYYEPDQYADSYYNQYEDSYYQPHDMEQPPVDKQQDPEPSMPQEANFLDWRTSW